MITTHAPQKAALDRAIKRAREKAARLDARLEALRKDRSALPKTLEACEAARRAAWRRWAEAQHPALFD